MKTDAPAGVAAFAVADAVRKALRESEVEVLQPMMRLEVQVDAADVGAVTTDIRWVDARVCTSAATQLVHFFRFQSPQCPASWRGAEHLVRRGRRPPGGAGHCAAVVHDWLRQGRACADGRTVKVLRGEGVKWRRTNESDERIDQSLLPSAAFDLRFSHYDALTEAQRMQLLGR